MILKYGVFVGVGLRLDGSGSVSARVSKRMCMQAAVHTCMHVCSM